MSEQNQLSFKKVIGASVKDMRNSLGQVQYKLDTLMAEQTDAKELSELSDAQYEMVRMQNVINQLHGLYLLESDTLTVQMQEAYVLELVEDSLAGLETLLKHKQIEVELDADDISWYVDPHLIANVLQIILLNAIRYTENKISLVLNQSEDGLLISVIDNGKGYPQSVLDSFQSLVAGESVANVSSQNTSWLYCEKVALLHKNNALQGHTRLSNDSGTGGGRIDLLLP